jgi:hypothetical protein
MFMRRFLLASCIALLPGVALAQSDSAAPPPGGNAMMMMAAPNGGMDGSMGGSMAGPGGWGGKGGHHHFMDPAAFLMKFYAANTTHDGHLTLAQAKAAGFQPIVAHFTDIDVAKHGYVTFYDIQAWRLDDMAKHLEAKAAALRAQD